jgi:hypothetical protein
MASLEIDDLEPPHSQRRGPIDVKSFIVRSSVNQRASHLPHTRQFSRAPRIEHQNSGDAAHVSRSDDRHCSRTRRAASSSS